MQEVIGVSQTEALDADRLSRGRRLWAGFRRSQQAMTALGTVWEVAAISEGSPKNMLIGAAALGVTVANTRAASREIAVIDQAIAQTYEVPPTGLE